MRRARRRPTGAVAPGAEPAAWTSHALFVQCRRFGPSGAPGRLDGRITRTSDRGRLRPPPAPGVPGERVPRARADVRGDDRFVNVLGLGGWTSCPNPPGRVFNQEAAECVVFSRFSVLRSSACPSRRAPRAAIPASRSAAPARSRPAARARSRLAARAPSPPATPALDRLFFVSGDRSSVSSQGRAEPVPLVVLVLSR